MRGAKCVQVKNKEHSMARHPLILFYPMDHPPLTFDMKF